MSHGYIVISTNALPETLQKFVIQFTSPLAQSM